MSHPLGGGFDFQNLRPQDDIGDEYEVEEASDGGEQFENRSQENYCAQRDDDDAREDDVVDRFRPGDGNGQEQEGDLHSSLQHLEERNVYFNNQRQQAVEWIARLRDNAEEEREEIQNLADRVGVLEDRPDAGMYHP
jgi:hypothetical protein